MIIAISQTGYLIIGILVVVCLVALFFISYVMNKKTPIPKECQDLEENEACIGCKNVSCSHYKSEKEDSKE